MKDQTCCFTGHREIPPKEVPALRRALLETVEGLVRQGVLYYGTGGARGFDTLAAQAVLRLKRKYPCIRLILVLPCLTQTKGWPRREARRYEAIRRKADKVVYVAREYENGCMQKRNRHLVEHSGTCVCYCTRGTGGSAYTRRYAEEQGLRIIELNGCRKRKPK